MIRLAIYALALAGAAPPSIVRGPLADLTTPHQAVMLAAEAAPRGIPGRFVMTVRAVGRADGGRLFLNSELDYRDQRNLSIAVQPNAVASVLDAARARSDPALIGRTIVVTGVARRVRVDFTTRLGRPSGKYYFQTHVPVTRVSQIAFLPPQGGRAD